MCCMQTRILIPRQFQKRIHSIFSVVLSYVREPHRSVHAAHVHVHQGTSLGTNMLSTSPHMLQVGLAHSHSLIIADNRRTNEYIFDVLRQEVDGNAERREKRIIFFNSIIMCPPSSARFDISAPRDCVQAARCATPWNIRVELKN